MSRTDNTRPRKIRLADRNNIPARGIKLDELRTIVDEDPRPQVWSGIGDNIRGIRRQHQARYARQRRQRDKLACRMASASDYDVDVMPVSGDRKTISWDLS